MLDGYEQQTMRRHEFDCLQMVDMDEVREGAILRQSSHAGKQTDFFSKDMACQNMGID